MLFLSLHSFFKESGKKNFHLRNASFYAVDVLRRNAEEGEKRTEVCVCVCMYIYIYTG
jgi:hypothetical protein